MMVYTRYTCLTDDELAREVKSRPASDDLYVEVANRLLNYIELKDDYRKLEDYAESLCRRLGIDMWEKP